MIITEPTLIDILRVANDLPDDERAQVASSFGEFDCERLATSLYLTPGVKFAFSWDGEPYAVGGYQPYSEGVKQSWMICRNGLWERHGKEITRAVRKISDAVLAENGTRRLQTLCLTSRTAAIKWYRILALNQEGIMIKAGANGEDLALFSRVKE